MNNKQKGRLKSRPRPPELNSSRSNPSILLLISCCLIVATAAELKQQHHANLPKVGLISGLTIAAAEGLSGAEDSKQQQQQVVVGFLGIPYAAPPVGPLRFMPPGALQLQLQQQQQQSNKPTSQQQQLVLTLPNGQRAQARSFQRFGSRCVHLADWLPSSTAQAENVTLNSDDDHRDNNQSEDCLNLNVFVPIKRQQTITANNSNSIGDDHAQFGPTTTTTTTTTTTDRAQRLRVSWPLPTGSKLPILVVVSAAAAPATQRDEPSKMALLAESIVITFNYRTGLLGFLPYADDEDLSSSSTGNNNKSRRQSAAARLNHAIWDQIGLLHWIRKNAHAFGGDPSRVTLAAADSRSSLHLQLLCISPLAKGLFSRTILLQRQRGCSAASEVDLGQLIEVSGKTGLELRQRLSASLADIVFNHLKLNQSRAVFEAIGSASLQQLAQVDQQLQAKLSQKMLLLVSEPSLDDNLLFPHLRPLVEHMTANGGHPLLRSLQAELNYCSYIRRIYKSSSQQTNSSQLEDPLQLLPSDLSFAAQWNRTSSNATAAGWHRDSTNQSKSPTDSFFSSSRTMAVQYFNHLNHLQSLNRILATNRSHPEESPFAITELGLDNQRSRVEKREIAQSVEDTNLLAELLAPIDILFGYIKCSKPSVDAVAPARYDKRNFARLAESLLNVSSSSREHLTTIDNNLIGWLKWIDFHDVLRASQQTSSSAASVTSNSINIGQQHCDFSNNNILPRDSFMFVLNDNEGDTDSLLLSSLVSPASKNTSEGQKIHSGLKEFIRFGRAVDSQWPIYSSLSRDFRAQEEDYEWMREQFLVRLDLVPYLSEDLPKLMMKSPNNRTTTTTTSDSPGNKSPVQVLYSCLVDLEADLAVGTSSKQNQRQCLVASLNKLRALTRRYAAQDLEPLLWALRMRQNNNQVSDFGLERSSGSASSITTRNLVNQMPELDDESLAADGESHLIHVAAATNGSRVDRQIPPPSSSAKQQESSLLKKLLGLTFRDTSAGRALIVVVVAGLVIFLANLVIVIVMTVRSSERRRRGQQQMSPGEPKSTNNNNNNKVHDLVFVEPLPAKSILQQPQRGQPIAVRGNHRNDQSLNDRDDEDEDDCLSAAAHATRLASSLRRADGFSDANNRSQQQQQQQQCGHTRKQLKFNLDEDQAEQQQMIELNDLIRGDRLIQLDASPLLRDQVATQYELLAHESPTQCAVHRQQQQQPNFSDQSQIRDAYAVQSGIDKLAVIQSPPSFNHSLLSHDATSSSTFRQSGSSSERQTAIAHQHPELGGGSICHGGGGHSPNSSTTLSMTPNQQNDSLVLAFPSHQLDMLNPHQHQHHHHHLHHLHSSAEISPPLNQHHFHMSESELLSTLKRQHRANGIPHHNHHHHHA